MTVCPDTFLKGQAFVKSGTIPTQSECLRDILEVEHAARAALHQGPIVDLRSSAVMSRFCNCFLFVGPLVRLSR